MATTLPVYYAGPGKVYFNAPYGTGTTTTGTNLIGFQPADVNGQISCSVDMTTATRGAAMYGEIFETLTDITGKISMTPFDNWSLLPYLFPWYIGVTTGAATYGGTGLLNVGTNPFDPGNTGVATPAGVWTADGREYNFNRAALIKHPSMKFAPGEKLFGSFDIACLGNLVLNSGTVAALPGNEGFLMSATEGTPIGNPITESAPASGAIGSGSATDPDTTGFSITDFAQTHWLGQFGTISGTTVSPIAGFGNLEGENGWELVPDVKYNQIKVQGITRLYKLSSARFMLKCKLVGPSHTALLAQILGTGGTGGYGSGSIITGASTYALKLTGSNGKYCILNNCAVKNAPFEFGSTGLNTGEIGFVTETTITSANPNIGSGVGAVPCLTFSS
jgi:hypothetical protein